MSKLLVKSVCLEYRTQNGAAAKHRPDTKYIKRYMDGY